MAGFSSISTAPIYNEDEDSLEIPQPDGGVVIQFNPQRARKPSENQDFYRNLVDEVDPSIMGYLSHEILDGIQADEQSRTQWLADRTRGMDLLAVKVEAARADIGGAGAPLDGMSTVRSPLLLEACIKFQANFKREMLPASGPVKIKDEGNIDADAQAEKLGDLMNRYFTEFAPEYYPDTDRMSFDLGFSGKTFKKLFHCPIRRRPCSDTVEGKDLIVSNDAKDLRTAQRVTHQLTMSQAMMKRMQFVKAYRDIVLPRPDDMPDDPLTLKQKNIQGISDSHRPQDHLYTIYECYTNLDLKGFEHRGENGQPTGLPQPYKVTIERGSRQILEIRRNWEEDSETFEPRRVFVAYDFVPMFGFYSTGLLNILGNPTQAVTGAWRILLDTGIFANFPGFIYARNGARQDNLSLRVPPGGGAAVDLGGMDDIRKTIMALPYKDPGANTMQLVDNITQTAQRVGGTANMIDQENVRQNMPVGTTMAIVEQQAILIGAVHERNYVSQSHEFQQMLMLFREDPESLWRFIKNDAVWTYEELVQTLNTYTLVPVADPNTPTHVHRIMKMTTLKQLQGMNPDIYDARKVDAAVLRAMKFANPTEFFAPPPPPQAMPQDPAVVVAQSVERTKMADIQTKMKLEMMKLQSAQSLGELETRLEMMKLELERNMGQQTTHAKMIDTTVRARTAAEDRESKERIERAKLAHASETHHTTLASDHVGAHHDRLHEAQQAELDRKNAIAAIKAKPKPKPAAKSK